jgi:23S rRNA (pseudouridine1915-N3)-methyltransferase
LPHSPAEGVGARQDESDRILQRLNPDDFVVLLDERGKFLDSPALARQMEMVFPTGKNIVCIIGGAYGVNEALTRRANLVWSLSPLVFPHQLVRLILIVQIYWSLEIALGHPYHHI